jgi:hypothetical protein
MKTSFHKSRLLWAKEIREATKIRGNPVK